MSLRSKIVLLLTAVVLAYAGLDHLVQRMVVYESFVELEASFAQKDVARVNDGIKADRDARTRQRRLGEGRAAEEPCDRQGLQRIQTVLLRHDVSDEHLAPGLHL
jgi:ABC-type siderophore export system fused ATPase/permease subunit